MQQLTNSCALDCCECGVVVGTEGSQRGTLLLPCQHILHMGCVEFIKRRGKLLMGMESTDVMQDEGADVAGASSSNGHSKSSNPSWIRQMHGRCLCPACYNPITHIIPLYLRSEDDPVTNLKNKSDANGASTVSSSPPTASRMEENYRRVHAAQKRVLLRLRSLCEQRRRMTELTHACASLHEQRARYLGDVEKEERCFPGLIGEGSGQDGLAVPSASSGGGIRASAESIGVPIEKMGITELEMYMAQITPLLLRTQAEVRRERQLVERRAKKLNVLRSHYHSTKDLRALDAEIAERKAKVRSDSRKSAVALHDHVQSSVLQQQYTVMPSASEQQQHHHESYSAEELIFSPRASGVPVRKKFRGEEAIDVDDEPLAEVVEVPSQGASDDDEPEVVVLGDDAAVEFVQDSGVEIVGEDDVTADEANAYEAPYLIPCYVRASTSAAASSANPKVPHMILTHNHIRMLPRREDRLWQPSLQF
ncbi:hypothetical protein ABL78_4384 [Leptomonas seymouri]|uniref:Uncharacterized protein n=1 Tax=Leptomonas seymouri TaxID=5684 RepID=A0A0N1HYA9_LEPSE|nr:hypothetical protein ABL78_4384 [Leptomonas seymouri]|eukprot:KPI86561.1 hypothetical protein ABL78_4384 [Leptomonas seymouri]